MRRFLLVVSFAVLLACLGCSGDDSSAEPTSAPVSEAFELDLVGEYWGIDSSGLQYYRLDSADCGDGIGYIIYEDGAEPLPAETTCDNIGEGNLLAFTLDMSTCWALDSRARREVYNCSIDEGQIIDLDITWSPTYPDSPSADGYGEILLFATLPDGSTFYVSGPFSHCAGGADCASDE